MITFADFIRLGILACFCLGIISFICSYLYFRWKYSYWKPYKIPTTKPKFPLGDIAEVGFFKNIGDVLKEIYDQFPGERYNGMWIFHRPFFMPRDPELIKSMCIRDFRYFRDRGLFNNEKIDPLSANLFVIGGSKWRNIRIRMSPNFSTNKMRKMFNIMLSKGTNLKDVLYGPAKNEEIIEPKEFTVRYTHDVIASCVLGLQAGCLQNPRSIFRRVGKKVFEPSWPTILRGAFSFLLPDVANVLRITPTPQPVADFFLDVVKDLMLFRETNGVHTTDIIQLLVKLKNQAHLDDLDLKDINGNDDAKAVGKFHFTFEDAVAQAFIFWVGGFETSATTMQFALYEMAMNPDVQEKAREEVKRTLAKFDGKIAYESLPEMDYLGRVVDGQRFALMQIKIGLINLLSNYKFETVPKTPKKVNCCEKLIIYSVKNGIPLKITKLED